MQDFIHYAAALWLTDCLIAGMSMCTVRLPIKLLNECIFTDGLMDIKLLTRVERSACGSSLSARVASYKRTDAAKKSFQIANTYQHSNSFIFCKHFIPIRVIPNPTPTAGTSREAGTGHQSITACNIEHQFLPLEMRGMTTLKHFIPLCAGMTDAATAKPPFRNPNFSNN